MRFKICKTQSQFKDIWKQEFFYKQSLTNRQEHFKKSSTRKYFFFYLNLKEAFKVKKLDTDKIYDQINWCIIFRPNFPYLEG